MKKHTMLVICGKIYLRNARLLVNGFFAIRDEWPLRWHGPQQFSAGRAWSADRGRRTFHHVTGLRGQGHRRGVRCDWSARPANGRLGQVRAVSRCAPPLGSRALSENPPASPGHVFCVESRCLELWMGCFCDTTASHLISVGDFVVWTEVRIGDFFMFFVWAEYTNSPFPLPRCLLYFRECWRRAGW